MQEDLCTIVVNPTGSAKRYSFIPPHGVLVAAGAEYFFPGNLLTALASAPGGARRVKIFDQLLEDEMIAIRKTPRVLLFDETTGDTKGLAVANGTLGTVNPEWGALASA